MRPLYLVAVISTRLITVFSMLIISYISSPIEFGKYTLITTNSLLLQIIIGSWITSIASRQLVSENEVNKEIFSSIASASLAVSAITIAISVIYISIFGINEKSISFAATALLAVSIFLFDTTLSAKNALGKENEYMRLSIVRNTVSLLLSVTFVMCGLGYLGAAAGQIFGTLISIASSHSSIEMWKNASISINYFKKIIKHIQLGIAGAAMLGIYIFINAPSRNIIGKYVSVSGSGAWALSSDLFYGPIAILGNAFALSQMRLLYLAVESNKKDESSIYARDLIEFTLAIVTPYTIGGMFFSHEIVKLVFSENQNHEMTQIVRQSIIQGASILILYNLASISIAFKKNYTTFAMIGSAAIMTAIATSFGKTLYQMTLFSSVTCSIVVFSWLIILNRRRFLQIRISEIGKLFTSSLSLIVFALATMPILSFQYGWIFSMIISGFAFIVTAIWVKLAGIQHLLPSRLRAARR